MLWCGYFTCAPRDSRNPPIHVPASCLLLTIMLSPSMYPGRWVKSSCSWGWARAASSVPGAPRQLWSCSATYPESAEPSAAIRVVYLCYENLARKFFILMQGNKTDAINTTSRLIYNWCSKSRIPWYLTKSVYDYHNVIHGRTKLQDASRWACFSQ